LSHQAALLPPPPQQQKKQQQQQQIKASLARCYPQHQYQQPYAMMQQFVNRSSNIAAVNRSSNNSSSNIAIIGKQTSHITVLPATYH
jgi:hypothetical protein